MEKNNQVSKMADIYRSASSVLIHLGDELIKAPGVFSEIESVPKLSFAEMFSFLNRD